MRKFCYKCGALEEDKGPLIDGLCQTCFAEEHPLIRAPEKVDLEVCGRCGAYLLDGGWREPKEESTSTTLQAAREAVLSKITVAKRGPTGVKYVGFSEAENLEVEFEPELVPPDVVVEVRVRGKIVEDQLEEQEGRAEVVVNVGVTTCDVCSRAMSGYYEAILQIRGENDISEEKLSEVYRDLENYVVEKRGRDRTAFVAKVERKHGGLDLYLGSKDLARNMAKLLKSNYGGEIAESAELVGRTRNGRDKYRITVVVRFS